MRIVCGVGTEKIVPDQIINQKKYNSPGRDIQRRKIRSRKTHYRVFGEFSILDCGGNDGVFSGQRITREHRIASEGFHLTSTEVVVYGL